MDHDQNTTTAPILIDRTTAVWTVTLNLEYKRNALDLSDRRALTKALQAADSAPDCVAIVLTGAGPIFCAGGDIAGMTADPVVARTRMNALTELANALFRNRKPIIAAVNGGAYGLGLSLAAAADYVVAAHNARLVASFGEIGLHADTGLSWSLTQRVGASRAKALILWGTMLSAEEAHAIGLVSECVEPHAVLDRAKQVASRFLETSPPMIAATKRTFAQPDQGLDAILDAEAEAQIELLGTAEFGLRQNAFLSKRAHRGRP